jgi:CHASE3 domain sensor protein
MSIVEHHEKREGEPVEESNDIRDTLVVVTGIALFLIVVGLWYVFIR